MKKLSLVITVMNEEENIQPLCSQIKEALDGIDYEVVFVDDGSTDKTVSEIKKYSTERFKTVIFNKNYGQSPAMAAGIDAAEGEYICTLDGDLQNDPSDIPAMLKKAEDEGWDLVAGNRANRQDGAVLRKAPSKVANYFIRRLTKVTIKDYGCTLKVFKQDIAKNLGLYGDLHRFIPVLASLQGASIVQVDVKHHPRIHGTSKYNLNRTFKVISDLMLIVFFKRYFQKPMHLFGTAGVVTFGIGVLINMYLFALKILGHDIWGRPLLLLGVLLIMGGIQLITIGIIAELLMRTYYESQNKTVYRIKETYIGEPVKE